MSLKPPLPPNTLLDYRHVYDEGSQQTAEDGINFTGAGVTVSDDPTNHRLNVTIPGASVTLADGAEPYLAVDSLSATPRSVTDWGVLLNTAIAAGTRRFLFGPYDYPFTTTIAANDVRGVHFSGASAYMGGGAQPGRTSMTWGGTGAGYAINMRTASAGYGGGGYFEHIAFLYSQTGTYTGRYFDFNNAFFIKFEHCDFSTSGDVTGTAAACMDAHNMNTLIVSECNFGRGFKVAVRGVDPAENACFSNVFRADECTFQEAAIENPGVDYLLTHCVFEMDTLPANTSVIYDTATYTPAGGVSIALRDCAYWDMGPDRATNHVVYAQHNYWTFTAVDCIDHSEGRGLASLYTIATGGAGINTAVNIRGGSTCNDIDVGNGATAYKYIVNVSDVVFRFNSVLLNYNTGHGYIRIVGNFGIGAADGWVRSSQEIVNLVEGATIQVHGGATGVSISQSYGSDLSGIISITNGTGSPSSTGALIDVLLAHPYVQTDTGHQTYLAVQLTPISMASFGVGAPTNFYGCQTYASATWRDVTKFSINVVNALPAGQGMTFAYRVSILEMV